MDKKQASTDYTYCVNEECTKECSRKASNYEFNPNYLYSFMDKCIEGEGK